jgi:hypothetical protein
MLEQDIFDNNEFVFTQKDGEFVGGGYKVNSFFLQNDISPITTYNNSDQQGGNVSSPFENLAVPAGLFYINQRIPKQNKTNNHYEKHEMISDDVMDKLFGLIEADKKKKRKTRKNVDKKYNNNNKSRKVKN